MIDSVSLQVGRPRPNFVALCWPDGAVVWDPDTGLAVCSPNAMNPAEGRKSFPSGDQLYYLLSSQPLHSVYSAAAAWCCFGRRVAAPWAVLMSCCLAPFHNGSRLVTRWSGLYEG